MANYVKGNLIQLFYHNGTAWKTLGYTQSNSLSMSNETNSISSKDHGLFPETEITGSSWSMSGECYFTIDNANVITGMHDAKTQYSVVFALVDQEDFASGLKSVSGSEKGAEAWTITSNKWLRYGTGLVTSCQLSANNGEVATMSIEITGSGALQSTIPSTGLKSFSASAGTPAGQNED